MKFDLSHPRNQGIIRKRSHRPDAKPVSLPHEHKDPYYELGCHPDVVEFLWDTLGRRMPFESRGVIYGTPALVQSRSGIVLALGYGTAYAILIPEDQQGPARSSGYTTSRQWSNGERTDLENELGPGWFFGTYNTNQEVVWLGHWYSIE